jgi:hypothetical protein
MIDTTIIVPGGVREGLSTWESDDAMRRKEKIGEEGCSYA